MSKFPSMKFPLPVLSERITFSTGGNTVGAGLTVYIYCGDQEGSIGINWSVNEAVVVCNYIVTRGGLLKNLVAGVQGTPGVGQTYVYTVRINGIPTAITCTIAAGQTTASDLVNTAYVVVGDRVTLELVTSAAAGVRTHTVSIEMDTPSTRKPYEHSSFCSGASTIAANTTAYLMDSHRLYGIGGISVIELGTQVSHINTRKGTLKNFIALASSAAGAGESFTYNFRVNGVTIVTITISGAIQLTNLDTASVIQVNPGDRITLQAVTSLAAAVATHSTSFDFEEGDYRAG